MELFRDVTGHVLWSIDTVSGDYKSSQCSIQGYGVRRCVMCGTGRLPGEAQGLCQACPIIPSPLRNDRVTPIPAEHGTADQREYRSEGVAFATVVMTIRHLGQHLDQWTRV